MDCISILPAKDSAWYTDNNDIESVSALYFSPDKNNFIMWSYLTGDREDLSISAYQLNITSDCRTVIKSETDNVEIRGANIFIESKNTGSVKISSKSTTYNDAEIWLGDGAINIDAPSGVYINGEMYSGGGNIQYASGDAISIDHTSHDEVSDYFHLFETRTKSDGILSTTVQSISGEKQFLDGIRLFNAGDYSTCITNAIYQGGYSKIYFGGSNNNFITSTKFGCNNNGDDDNLGIIINAKTIAFDNIGSKNRNNNYRLSDIFTHNNNITSLSDTTYSEYSLTTSSFASGATSFTYSSALTKYEYDIYDEPYLVSWEPGTSTFSRFNTTTHFYSKYIYSSNKLDFSNLGINVNFNITATGMSKYVTCAYCYGDSYYSIYPFVYYEIYLTGYSGTNRSGTKLFEYKVGTDYTYTGSSARSCTFKKLISDIINLNSTSYTGYVYLYTDIRVYKISFYHYYENSIYCDACHEDTYAETYIYPSNVNGTCRITSYNSGLIEVYNNNVTYDVGMKLTYANLANDIIPTSSKLNIVNNSLMFSKAFNTMIPAEEIYDMSTTSDILNFNSNYDISYINEDGIFLKPYDSDTLFTANKNELMFLVKGNNNNYLKSCLIVNSNKLYVSNSNSSSYKTPQYYMTYESGKLYLNYKTSYNYTYNAFSNSYKIYISPYDGIRISGYKNGSTVLKSSNSDFTTFIMFSSSAKPYTTYSTYFNGTVSSSSDERFKDIQNTIDIDFDKLKSIPKFTYTWKDSILKEDNDLHIGTSAQAIRDVYPEIVHVYNSDVELCAPRDIYDPDAVLAIEYDKLSVIALAAIDKLHEENVQLKEENEQLKTRLDNLEQLLKDKGII